MMAHHDDGRLMQSLSYRRAIEDLHKLGPRAVGELLADVAEAEGCKATVRDLLFRNSLPRDRRSAR